VGQEGETRSGSHPSHERRGCRRSYRRETVLRAILGAILKIAQVLQQREFVGGKVELPVGERHTVRHVDTRSARAHARKYKRTRGRGIKCGEGDFSAGANTSPYCEKKYFYFKESRPANVFADRIVSVNLLPPR
jgi:hypothetical protein